MICIKLKLATVWIIFFSIVEQTQICNHDKLTEQEKIVYKKPIMRWYYVPNRTGPIVLNPRNIRIKLIYANEIKAHPNYYYYKKNIERVVTKIEKSVKIKYRPKEPLLVKRDCIKGYPFLTPNDTVLCEYGCVNISYCVTFPIPEFLLEKCYAKNGTYGKDGSGMTGADLIVFVQNNQSCNLNETVSGYPCMRHDEYSRPIFGTLTICDNHLGTNEKNFIGLLWHNMFHILAMSERLYPLYLYENGTEIVRRCYTGESCAIIFAYDPPLGDTIFQEELFPTGPERIRYTILYLPRSLKEARKHFNCPTLKHMYLENTKTMLPGNPILYYSSHWEKQMFGNELLTVVDHGYGKLSRISVALLEDSGWYIADYGMADPTYSFGKDTGCDIFKGCYYYMQERLNKGLPIEPFCNEIQTIGKSLRCTSENYIEICTRKYNSIAIEPKYQYFKNVFGNQSDAQLCMYYYSPNHFASYCPMYEIYYEQQTDYVGDCKISPNRTAAINSLMPKFNNMEPKAICIHSIFNRIGNDKHLNGAVCLTKRCFKDGTSGYFGSSSEVLICSYSGQQTKGIHSGAAYIFTCPKFYCEKITTTTTKSNKVDKLVSSSNTTKTTKKSKNIIKFYSWLLMIYVINIIKNSI